MKIKVYAPKEYWNTPPEEIDKITGGCGPGGFGDFLVPDTVWFLSIKLACRIHDFMYAIGRTHKDKVIADRVFLYNMIRIVEANTRNKWLLKRRIKRCIIYFESVSKLGGISYWKNKNTEDEFKEVDDLLLIEA